MAKRWLFPLICLTLLITMAGGFFGTLTQALAADGTTPTPTPTPEIPLLALQAQTPAYFGDSGSTFTYSVSIGYNGSDRKTFNLSTVTPQGWNSFIFDSSNKEIPSIALGPADTFGPAAASLTINMGPGSTGFPDPGEYTLTLKATSGSLSQSIELKAIVRARYLFSITTDSGRLSAEITSGQQNHYSFNLVNNSSTALTDIVMNASAPSDWTITFDPPNVPSLAPGMTQKVDAIIVPPGGKTIAGDYMVTIRANNPKVSSSIDVRVTVLTPSIWGWVGIILVVVVIVGLAILFRKLGRR